MTTTEKHDCAGRVYGDRVMSGYPCTKNGTHHEGEKWWCGTHAPSKIAAKREARSAKYRDEREADSALLDRAEQRAAELSATLGKRVTTVARFKLTGSYRLLGYHMVLTDEYVGRT